MLTNAGKDAALLSLFVHETVYLSIRSAGTVSEPSQRKLVQFTEPSGADRHIENRAELSFLVTKAQTVDGWQITDSAGVALANGELEEELPMRANEEVVFRPGDVVLRIEP